MSNEGYPEDFGVGDDLDVRGSNRHEVADVATEFKGFRVGDQVRVAGMPGEFVVKAFSTESAEAHLAASVDDDLEHMIMVAVDRLEKK